MRLRKAGAPAGGGSVERTPSDRQTISARCATRKFLLASIEATSRPSTRALMHGSCSPPVDPEQGERREQTCDESSARMAPNHLGLQQKWPKVALITSGALDSAPAGSAARISSSSCSSKTSYPRTPPDKSGEKRGGRKFVCARVIGDVWTRRQQGGRRRWTGRIQSLVVLGAVAQHTVRHMVQVRHQRDDSTLSDRPVSHLFGCGTWWCVWRPWSSSSRRTAQRDGAQKTQNSQEPIAAAAAEANTVSASGALHLPSAPSALRPPPPVCQAGARPLSPEASRPAAPA